MKIKKLIIQMLVFLSLTSILLLANIANNETIQAATEPYTPKPLDEGLQLIQTETKQPDFGTRIHEDASIESGASNITSAIYFVLDFMKFGIGSIAVVLIIISGVRLILGRKKVDEVWNKQKEHLIMIATGFVIIMIADVLVRNVFFGVEGEVYESQAQAQEAAREGTKQLKGIYNAALVIVGALAVFMLVVAGIRLLVSGGNEEAQTKAKKQITWIVLGLFLLGTAEFVVQDFIFPDQGREIPDADKGKMLIKDFTNFASAFITIISVVAFIYGGYLYVTAVGNEEKTGKAKKVFIGAIIALILAAGAYALVNAVIPLDVTGEGGVGT